MPYSASVVAGVGVGCAAFAFIIACPLVLWFRRWLLTDLPEPLEPDDVWNQRRLHECVRVLERAQALEPPHEEGQSLWDLDYAMAGLTNCVDVFLLHFDNCDFELQGVPDHAKLRYLAGGDYEDWASLPTLRHMRLQFLLTRTVLRALCLRMDPDGDCSITLLPADILSTYQRIRTKLQPPPIVAYERTGCTYDDRLHATWILRKYWRLFAVDWSSDWCARLQAESTNDQPARPGVIGTFPTKESPTRADDPRMPNILAVEALIEDALEPFWNSATFKPDYYKSETEARAEAKSYLRKAIVHAADIGLRLFAELPEHEFFWPTTNVREGPQPFNDPAGEVICFGVRRSGFYGKPWTWRSEYNEALERQDMGFAYEPKYSDFFRIHCWMDEHFVEVKEGLEQRRRMKKAGGGLDEGDKERRQWEEKERIMEACCAVTNAYPQSRK